MQFCILSGKLLRFTRLSKSFSNSFSLLVTELLLRSLFPERQQSFVKLIVRRNRLSIDIVLFDTLMNLVELSHHSAVCCVDIAFRTVAVKSNDCLLFIRWYFIVLHINTFLYIVFNNGDSGRTRTCNLHRIGGDGTRTVLAVIMELINRIELLSLVYKTNALPLS